MVKKINQFEIYNRKLEIQFNIHMDKEVDKKVLDILKNLFENKFPVNQFSNLKYTLRNKKRMMGGTVNIPKLYENEALVYVDYPGVFKKNDENDFKFKDLNNFDKEEFEETALHETVHAYHVLHGKYAKEVLSELLEFDKFKDKKDSKNHVINELNRFSRNCYFEGYAQVICHLGIYYKHTKKSLNEKYKELIEFSKELNKAITKFKEKGVKKDILELLSFIPYRFGPQIYSFIMYYNKREFKDFKDYNVEQLFQEYEKVFEENNLEIPISLNSGKGIFDIEETKKNISKYFKV